MADTIPAPSEISGDYDHSGNVGTADYILWRRSLGTTDARYVGADGDDLPPGEGGLRRAKISCLAISEIERREGKWLLKQQPLKVRP